LRGVVGLYGPHMTMSKVRVSESRYKLEHKLVKYSVIDLRYIVSLRFFEF
jgi:hypothetical protein